MTKNIVDEKQLAAFAGSFPLPTEHPGLTLVFGIANPGVDAATLETAMNAEFEKVKNELISDKELQKLKNQMESNFIQGYGTVAGIAEALSDYYLYYGDANLINTEINRYLAVTKEDIQRVANKYFQDQSRVVLYWLPKAQ